ncbi:MAG: recombinase family protein [Comamonadaceae bacterium]|nr:MAG: recombinase family protein [Comamonadaceae bacterium]
MLVRYARVSTVDQETDLQFAALRRAGVRKIYSEKTGGVSARPQLQKLLSELKFGDQLVVYKLDRLARSLRDLLNIIERIDKMSCDFRSLTEPIDTGTPAGRLMLQILGAVAEFERSLIRERSMAGQAVAMSRGVVCGRPRNMSIHDEAALLQLWQSGDYTLATLARIFDVHESTVKRAVYRVHKPGHSSLL